MPWIQPAPQTYAKLVPTLEQNIIQKFKRDTLFQVEINNIPDIKESTWFEVDMSALEDVIQTTPHHIRQFIEQRYVQKLSRRKLQQALNLEVAGLVFLEEQTTNYLTHPEFIRHYIRTETSVAPTDNRILDVQNQLLRHTLDAIRDGRLTAEHVTYNHITPRPDFDGPTLYYIEHLPFSTIAYHALHRAGVTSVERLQSVGLKQLGMLRNLGIHSVREIATICAEHGIDIHDEPQDVSFTTPSLLRLPSIDDLDMMINGVANGYQDHIELPIYHDAQPGGTP